MASRDEGGGQEGTGPPTGSGQESGFTLMALLSYGEF